MISYSLSDTMLLSGRKLVQIFISTCALGVVFGIDTDRFNYYKTDGNDYGPKDWRKVKCSDPETCLGYTESLINSQGWEIDTSNFCTWCPASGNSCGTHHSSPIDLNRNRAVKGDPDFNECIDKHWMAYFDSSCSYDDLRAKNAFTIERYALKITQPIDKAAGRVNGLYPIDCRRKTDGKRIWGSIDFSKGFSQWWYLSHIHFHVPSEHTQEGKKYSGEIEMYHFYSVSADVAGVHNEMGTVSIFLEEKDGAKAWSALDKIICAWRESEEKNREVCGLSSVTSKYDGCPSYNRKLRNRDRNLRQSFNQTFIEDVEDVFKELPTIPEPALSAYDILLENHHHKVLGNLSHKPKIISIDHDTEIERSRAMFDWDTFLEEHLKAEEQEDGQRKNASRLLRGEDGKWFNYFPLPAVKTEYYFRYSGTQTTPPCYGEFISGKDNRKQTNHWRVMKDPIIVPPHQIKEMHRLLKDRIAPANDPIRKCKKDTGAADESGGLVNVARPIQETTKAHFEVFCECEDWKSKFSEDQQWCKQSKNDRLFKNPYNFKNSGF